MRLTDANGEWWDTDMFDADIYQGPIRIIYGEMQLQIENAVLEAVQKVGVDVDKGELLKALAYDRGQYEKGRADALASIVRCKDCKQWDEEQGRMGRGWCGVRIYMTRPEWYCWDGDREETAEEEQEETDADTP